MYDNLNNYKAFYTVAKLGSISHAAESLYVSQPALSKAISKLEEGLGAKLFERSSRGVRLTNEGEILFSYITNAFDSITKAEDEIKRINELGIGQLKIGVSTSLCKHILLDYLQAFINENPHIKVIIDCHSTVNTMKLLREREIDIGLICETEIPKDFIYTPLQDIHDIFVASNAYLENLFLRENDDAEKEFIEPFLFAGNISPAMLTGTHTKKAAPTLSGTQIIEKSMLMMLEKNNITRTHIDSYLAAEGIIPSQILEINSMDLLIDFASIGMGVACVVKEFAREYIDNGQIVELTLEKEIKKRTVGFVYPKGKHMPAALSKFLSFIEDSF